MPAVVRISVEGEDVFYRTFSRLDENFQDISFLWDDVRDKFFEIEQDQFQSEGAKGASGKWKPLSKRYEIQKINRYGSFALLAGILIASETMYKSLTRMTDHTVYKKDKKEMVVGTDLPYAKYHQRGGGRLPQRKIIDFSEAQKKDLQKTIQKSLLKELKRSGITYTTEL